MLAAAVVGAITAGRRALWVVAPAALIGVGFLVLAAAGLSLQSRYLVGIAAVAALLAGVALTGRWRWVGGLLLAARRCTRAGDLADTRERLDDDAPAAGGARAGGAAVRAGRTCRRSGRCPFVAYWADRARAGRRARRPAPEGSLITPTGASESWIGGGGPGRRGGCEVAPPPGYAPLSENDAAWRVYTKC